MHSSNPFFHTHIICTPKDKDRWLELFDKYDIKLSGPYAWKHLYIGGYENVLQQWDEKGNEIDPSYQPHGSFRLITLSHFDDNMVDKEEIEKFKKQLIKEYGESDV